MRGELSTPGKVQCSWQIWLKREDLHPVFSFKIRGAYNMMAHLTEAEKNKGVITCSAGELVLAKRLSS